MQKNTFSRLICLALAVMTLLSGCSGQRETNGEAMALTAEGTLKRVEYSYTSGMTYGGDFSIDVTAAEIVSARYFTREGDAWPEEREKSHQPITAQQWQDIVQAVDALRPVLEPVPPPKEPTLLDRLMEKFGARVREETMDGGDSRELALTLERNGVEQRVRYCHPNDQRLLTLTDVLARVANS